MRNSMNISLRDNNSYFITLLAGMGAGLSALLAAGFIGGNLIYAVAMPFVLLLTLITFINLRYPLILILLLRPLMDPLLEMTRVDAAGQGMGVGALLNGLIILLTGLLLLKEQPSLTRVAGRKNWLIFLSLCIFSLFASVDPAKGFRLVLNFLSYFCLFLLPFILIRKRTEILFWLRILLASGTMVIFAGMIDFFLGGAYYPDAGQTIRIRGPFLHPNILAFYLILVIVICLFALEERLQLIPRLQGLLLSLMILLSGFLILETKTRNAWIALWLLLIIYSLLRHRRFLLPLLIMPFAALLIPSFSARVIEVFHPSHLSTNINSYAWRISVWKSTLPLIWQSPVIGHGLASFQLLSRSISKIAVKGGSAAHNVFLELLFETGIPGAISFVAIHAALLYSFIKESSKASRYLMVSLIASYCVISFGDNILFYLPYNWHYWFFIGVALIYLGDGHGQIQCNHSGV